MLSSLYDVLYGVKYGIYDGLRVVDRGVLSAVIVRL